MSQVAHAAMPSAERLDIGQLHLRRRSLMLLQCLAVQSTSPPIHQSTPRLLPSSHHGYDLGTTSPSFFSKIGKNAVACVLHSSPAWNC